MATPYTLNGTKLYIKVGDGASPEVFAHPCLINTDRGIEFTQNGNKVAVHDCTNPDNPAWMEFIPQSLEAAISGAGKMDNVEATIDSYNSWLAGELKNVQVWIGTVGYWAGAFALTKFSISGPDGDKIAVSISLESSGEVTWNAGS